MIISNPKKKNKKKAFFSSKKFFTPDELMYWDIISRFFYVYLIAFNKSYVNTLLITIVSQLVFLSIKVFPTIVRFNFKAFDSIIEG